MSLQHSFDINVAAEYGIIEAIMIKNFQFWIVKNKANGQNFFNGHYWTYNSVKAYERLYPYLTRNQIEYTLKKLEEKGILLSGNYNEIKFDRTKWYAFADEDKWLCISEISEMDSGKFRNRVSNFPKSLPDIKPDDKPDTKNLSPSEIRKIVKKYVEAMDNIKNVDAIVNHIIKNEPLQVKEIIERYEREKEKKRLELEHKEREKSTEYSAIPEDQWKELYKEI